MSNKSPIFNDSTMNSVLVKLAHFNPTYVDEYGHQVLDYLLLDTLANYDTLFKATPSGVRSVIQEIFKLEFDETEIVMSVRRLARKSIVECTENEDRFEYPEFSLKPEYQKKIHKNLAEIRELENDVIEEWKNELIHKYPGESVITQNVVSIVENLHIFISRMLLRHGIESVALLYPDSEKAQGWLNLVKDSIFENIPKIEPFVDTIIRIEVPNFFRKDDDKRKAYISSLFNSSFYWHLIQVDEKCSRLLKNVTKGQRLYLDNNVLFSLIGFHGATVLKAVHNLLRLAAELGYDLWVTTKTIDEFHNSLDWQLKEQNKKPPLPCELVRIAVENLEPDNFLTVYWKEFVETGIAITEFISEKSHIDAILDAFQIQVTNKFRNDIENSKKLAQEESLLRQVCGDFINENIVEHDAFHRIFIGKIRKGHKHHFREAVAWFLTHDSKLPKYGRFARKGQNYLPFCITTDQWIQINRPLLTRTLNEKEYDESFHILITQPFLRTLVPFHSLENTYQQILGKLSKYKNMSPELALEIVTDNHFAISIACEENDSEVEKQFENKFVDLASDFKERNIELERNVQQSSDKIISLGKELSKLQEGIIIFEKQNKTLKNSLSQLSEKHDSEQKSLQEKEDFRIKFETLKGNIKSWGFFLVLLLVGSLLIWFHSALIDKSFG